MKHLTYFIVFILFSCASVQPNKNIQGHFSGKADIIVSWCKTKSLFFDINIDESGFVNGKIGDAKITKGKLKTNSFSSEKYIIEADLNGFLLENEKIKRKLIKIPFNFSNGKIKGGFATNGSKFGGKDKMIMSGTNLILLKIKK